MIKLKSHVSGAWHEGRGETATLLNPATEEPLAETSTGGIDFKGALDYAREVGGPALRSMTFAERGACLRSIYDVLYA
ncbi:MAG: 3,4-dehydroadipyl-CoA semialdehyde dehydrogenase, partial [Rhodospirillaceae bacterium]|nr:3,4-dehydroadipyl-CoA semialdehyde dehydrogenase [Rhodospirillaceae bacterium]